jgi:hypothetical protein
MELLAAVIIMLALVMASDKIASAIQGLPGWKDPTKETEKKQQKE